MAESTNTNADSGPHPLENEWTLWYDRRQAQTHRGEKESWENNLQEVGSFKTVEEFWQYFAHIKRPLKMEVNSNYHLFKKGIKPMWEDNANREGGKWVVTVNHKHKLDEYWESVVLASIGETMDPGDEVCGLVLSRRQKGDRIALWNRDCSNKQAVHQLGEKFKEIFEHESKVEYNYHQDSIQTGQSYANPKRYTLSQQ
eukprot:TRINITY_DN20314_c0_g1::TRINITY_DN20314_c0_g1_i1::g.19737::m.19737 TRINITY_DN20314_c0_g1::TRINITY_DN20314_c0_g1_i1::g.19737  ORF type:complete len:220 (+),score=26.42,sp/O81482/IF4E2_MAIZE/39.13/4e-45,IF4E/PF01652.13/1.9e-57,RuvC/PF02075.12/0.024 TRINITY_DN20314_c0_g1_i1:65-661(+)